MIQANIAASTLRVPPHLHRAIEQRWLELEPRCKVKWQDSLTHVAFMKEIHRDLILWLRDNAIEMRVIRRLMLDDVTQDIHELERRRLRYIERRQRRNTNANQS